MNVINGRGGLPMLQVQTPWNTAEIYLQGACVTHFQPHGQPPLLFLSEKSRFTPDAPIRGGIPIIFPWFGKPPGRPIQHGFARTRKWDFIDATKLADESVRARFSLPPAPELPGIALEYHVTVGKALTVELLVSNYSETTCTFEDCLHTYFTIGNIENVGLTGLQGVRYIDSLDGSAVKTETASALQFSSEVDRIYFDSPQTVLIRDPELHRIIHVEKQNSRSTVVWNPWIAKARLMTDFGDDEYRRMVCVESGNIGANRIHLAPGTDHRLAVTVSSTPL